MCFVRCTIKYQKMIKIQWLRNINNSISKVTFLHVTTIPFMYPLSTLLKMLSFWEQRKKAFQKCGTPKGVQAYLVGCSQGPTTIIQIIPWINKENKKINYSHWMNCPWRKMKSMSCLLGRMTPPNIHKITHYSHQLLKSVYFLIIW